MAYHQQSTKLAIFSSQYYGNPLDASSQIQPCVVISEEEFQQQPMKFHSIPHNPGHAIQILQIHIVHLEVLLELASWFWVVQYLRHFDRKLVEYSTENSKDQP